MIIQPDQISTHRFSSVSLMKVSALALALGLFQAIELNTFATANFIEAPLCVSFGIGLSILIIFGFRYWPFVFAASALGGIAGGHDVLQSLLLGGSYTLSLLLGAIVLKYFKFERTLPTMRDFILLFSGGLVCALASTVLNMQIMGLLGTLPPGEWLPMYANWFVNVFFGIVFITSIILVLSTPFKSSIPRHMVLPFVIYSLLSLGLAQAIFFNWFPEWMGWADGRGALVYLVLMVAGIFFGRHGVLLLFLATLIQSVLSGVYGDAFITPDYFTRPLSVPLLQFLAFAFIFGIFSALVIQQLKKKNSELETTSGLYHAIGEAVLIANPDDVITLANSHFEKLTGLSTDAVTGTVFTDLFVKRHGASSYSDIFSSLSSTGRWEGQAWLKSSKGNDLHQFVSIFSSFDKSGNTEQRIILISELTEQRKARDIINQQANFDPLTGLPNRRLMSDRLDQLLKIANRANKNVAVIYLDLDNFKEINDSRGHDFGDLLLQKICERLRSEVRDSDTVARIGGDEFVVLLGDLDRPENADSVVQELLKVIRKPIDIEGQIIFASASLGIAFFPNDGTDAKALLLAADQAMYAAKEQGRNGHHYFTQGLQLQANLRSELVADLRKGVDDKQFELLFQPIVDLETGSINHAEVLLRWRRNDLELMMPEHFIGVAEDSGLIVEIGDWVMQQAIQFIRDLPTSQRISLAINVSAAQLNSDRHSSIAWSEWMTQANIDPNLIVIEVTERIMVLHSQRAQRKIKVLQEAGCLFSVDDFGTGYSSLALLREFDFDFIKIDQHFIEHLSQDGSDNAIVQAIISIAKGLGLLPIAEGVETQEQKVILLQLGCNYGQGYVFHEPMPADELKTLLSNTARLAPSV